jgi:hypothetical protein
MMKHGDSVVIRLQDGTEVSALLANRKGELWAVSVALGRFFRPSEYMVVAKFPPGVMFMVTD